MNDVMKIKQALDPELFVRVVNEKNRRMRMEREAAESKIIEFPRKEGCYEQRMETRPAHVSSGREANALTLREALATLRNEIARRKKRQRVPVVRVAAVPLREVQPMEGREK